MKKFQIQKQNSRFGQIAKKNQLHFQQQQEHFLAKRQKVEAQYQVPIAQQRVKIDRISPYLQNAVCFFVSCFSFSFILFKIY